MAERKAALGLLGAVGRRRGIVGSGGEGVNLTVGAVAGTGAGVRTGGGVRGG